MKEPRNVITSTQGLMDAGRRMKLTNPPPHAHLSSARAGHLTPPPEDRSVGVPRSSAAVPSGITPNGLPLTDDDIARRLSTFLASTPPDSEGHHHHTSSGASDHHFNSGSETELDHHHHDNSNSNFMSSRDQPWNESADADVKFSLHDNDQNHDNENGNSKFTNPFFADGAILVSNTISNATISNAGNPSSTLADFEPDFDSMINLDALGGFDESGFGGGMMQGESGGFALDMDWMQAGVGGGIGGDLGGDDHEDDGLGRLGGGQSALDGISRMGGGM